MMEVKRLKKSGRERLLYSLERNFGLDRKLFRQLEFFMNNKNKVFAVNRMLADFVGYGKFVSVSLPFARLDASIKPTTLMVQMFGRHAKKGIVELGREDAKRFMRGEDLETQKEGKGYAIIKYNGYPLGVGLMKGKEIKNQVPRAKRLEVESL